MTRAEKFWLLGLRLVFGWVFLWAGISKFITPNWSAAGYLSGAKNFTGFYGWLTSPAVLPVVNFLNEWGLTLLGISIILGLGIRISAVLGSVVMFLYYFVLPFPWPDGHSFLVDDHIVYAFVLLLLASIGVEDWSLGHWIARKFPRFPRFLV